MTHKVHIRSNTAESNIAKALCATTFLRNNKVRYNSRTTYAHMASEIVSLREAAALPADQLCAHCAEKALWFRNRVRAKNGKAPVADWRAY